MSLCESPLDDLNNNCCRIDLHTSYSVRIVDPWEIRLFYLQYLHTVVFTINIRDRKPDPPGGRLSVGLRSARHLYRTYRI